MLRPARAFFVRLLYLTQIRDRRVEAAVGGVVGALILVALLVISVDLVPLMLKLSRHHLWMSAAREFLFWAGALLLAFSALVHIVARWSARRPPVVHAPRVRDELEGYFGARAPAVSILIPCRGDQERALTRVLLSAALQTYPNRRIVLLADEPAPDRDERETVSARAWVRRVQEMFAEPARYFDGARAEFQARRAHGTLDHLQEARGLAQLNRVAADWYARIAEGQGQADPVDGHFVECVVLRQREEQRYRAEVWAGYLADAAAPPAEAAIAAEYHRLAALFALEITSFDRWRYANLSHSPGQAMCFNSYIALTGRNMRERLEGGQRYLEEGDACGTFFYVPEADYFLVLDAGAYLAPDALTQWMYYLEQEAQRDVAVVQAPGWAARGNQAMLARAASIMLDNGALLQRGYARHQAALWNGETGLVRKSALDDIARTEQEWGLNVTRYFRGAHHCDGNATSIEFLRRAWRTETYPERLVWTPPAADFAALAARCRRRTEGALVSLPALLGQLWQARLRRPLTALLLVHQQVAAVSVYLGLLLVFSVAGSTAPHAGWLVPAALAYALMYARDLAYGGYRWSDALRVYALQLLLIPLHLGTALSVLHRTWTDRTPALPGADDGPERDATSPWYHLAVFGLVVFWFTGAAIDLTSRHWLHGVIGAVNAAFLLYAAAGYVGFRAGLDDLQHAVRRRQRAQTWPRRPSYGVVVAGGDAPFEDPLMVDGRGSAATATPPLSWDAYAHRPDAPADANRARRVLVPPRKPSRSR
jgi:cellulose synthase/poly-beta-1,6-N-acetylglucosamine synthase-like glycosyltransferase